MNFRVKEYEDRHPTFQMTAMVDVVFMLLAFFVLASQLRLSERDFSMGYAEGVPTRKGTVAEDLPPDIPVYIWKTGGAVSISIAQARLRANDFNGIRDKLTEINLPNVGVRILAAPDLSVDEVTRALDAVLGSPMKNVSISGLKVPPVPGSG
jgi:biopolymer transport protein ExbD